MSFEPSRCTTIGTDDTKWVKVVPPKTLYQLKAVASYAEYVELLEGITNITDNLRKHNFVCYVDTDIGVIYVENDSDKGLTFLNLIVPSQYTVLKVQYQGALEILGPRVI